MKMLSVLRFAGRTILVTALGFAGPLALGQTGSGWDPSVIVVTVHAPDSSASESGDPGLFVLHRHGPTNLNLNVFLEISGTASNGVDYDEIHTWIPIPSGVREVGVPVIPKDDNLAEGPESVILRLVYSPLMMPTTYAIGVPSNAVVVIADNDGPPPTNRPPTVRLTSPADGDKFIAPVNVLLTAAAEDADGFVATVEFFDGNLSLGIRTNNPLAMSPLNPFMLIWSNAPPGEHVLRARAVDNHGATAWSDPVRITVEPEFAPVTVTIRATDPFASESGPLTVIDPGVFTICRDRSTNIDLPVYLAFGGTASNGVDYLRLSNVVVIPRGSFCAHLTVSPLNDNLIEGTETVVARVVPPLCVPIYPPPPECYQVGAPSEAVVHIADFNPGSNRPPAVRIVKPDAGVTFPAPANIGIIADTVDPDGYTTTVEFFANNQKIGEQTINFIVAPPPGEHIVFDFHWTGVPPGNYTMTARATDEQGASAWSDPVPILVFNTNNPPGNLTPIVSVVAADCVAAEGTNCWPTPRINYPTAGCLDCWTTNTCGINTATFHVRRAGPTNNALTVSYRLGGTASNGLDYVELPGQVTIPAGKRAAPVTVLPIEDNLPEKIETVVLELTPPALTSNTPPPYYLGFPRRAAAVILDKDQMPPRNGQLPDRCFHLHAPAGNGTWFRIESSTNLADWTAICTNMVTDGAIYFIDPDTEESANRFYRAISQPAPE